MSFRQWVAVAVAVVVGSSGLLLGLPAPAHACVNEGARIGASAALPDCRAFELVTPADTNGAAPITGGGGLGSLLTLPPDRFSSPPAPAGGDAFIFAVTGTAIPGFDGGGYINAYRAERRTDGWVSSLVGPSGPQAAAATPGGISPDQSYQTFRVAHLDGRYSGPLDLGQDGTHYLRLPDGSFRLVGEGTVPASPDGDGHPNGLADELAPTVEWISAGGSHIIFSQEWDPSQGRYPVPLLPESPAGGVAAVYDRTPTGLRLVSLLPGEVVPTTGSTFEGAAADGSTVLFRNAGILYARLDNTVTAEISAAGALAGGVSEDGEKAFYVDGDDAVGNLFSYDARTRESTAIASSGDARFVNVSADGSHAYFVSPSLLDGSRGAAGAPNLYVWDGASTRFITTVNEVDLVRETSPRVGLAQWVSNAPDSPARNGNFLAATSRLTADGTTFAFESSANLTGHDSGGRFEIYRYELPSEELRCISCVRQPAGSAGDAVFADYTFSVVASSTAIANLAADGEAVFFQADEPLVGADSNGATDVYEWREERLHLISTGKSPEPSLLIGATPSGDDVFIRTAQRLVSEGQESGIQAVYDARIGGGFLPASSSGAVCWLEACQGNPLVEPPQSQPVSALFVGPRDQPPRTKVRCKAKQRRKSKRPTKCVRRHRHRDTAPRRRSSPGA